MLLSKEILSMFVYIYRYGNVYELIDRYKLSINLYTLLWGDD